MTTFRTLFKRLSACTLLFAFLVCNLTGCLSSSKKEYEETLVIAVAMPEDDFRCEYVRQFAENVEEGTGGRIKCEIHYQDEYGDQLVIYDAVKKGTVDISVIAAPYFTDVVPEEGITGLPYLFRDHETAWAFAESEINRKIDEKLGKKGFHVMGHFCGSFRCLSNSVRAISTPDDMKGLVIGTVKSRTLMDMFSVLGATSYNYVSSELYDNLNRRTFDGADWSASTFYNNGYYKLQKYVAVTNHAYNLWNFIIRTELFNEMSDRERAVIGSAAQAACVAERDAVHKNENDIFTRLEEMGLVVSYPDLQPFIDATEKIREEYSGDFKDVYEETKVWIADR